MLEPRIELTKEHHYCTCGKPNFRNVNDKKPLYKIYKVEISKRVYGTEKFYLCEDCLKLLNPNNEVVK